MAKGMDAVLEKTDAARKKRPLLRKKGAGKDSGKPGMAIMIAVGGPKRGPGGPPEASFMRTGTRGEPRSSVDPIIAKLEARIAALEAKLADQEGEDEDMDEMEGEEMGEMEDEEYEEED